MAEAFVAEAFVAEVSTRRVDGLVQSMGVDGISKSQVSEMGRSLDAGVEAFRSRAARRRPYTYVDIRRPDPERARRRPHRQYRGGPRCQTPTPAGRSWASTCSPPSRGGVDGVPAEPGGPGLSQVSHDEDVRADTGGDSHAGLR